MASINLSGVLRDPLGEVSYGNKVRFTHTTTTGETLKGFRSIEEVVIDGAYDIDLEYGNVSIETFDKLNRHWVYHGNITINSDTPATSLPALLGITTPATDADLLVFQALVADAESSKLAAELAQEETEALLGNIDNSLAESLSVVLPSNPDVYLPFGNSIVKTLSGALSFERDSATGNINKSGALETLGVDEPAITKDGLSVYSGYANNASYSEDLSKWLLNGQPTSSDNTGHADPAGGSAGGKIVSSSTGQGWFKTNQHANTTDNASVWLLGESGGESVQFGFGTDRATVTLTTEWERYSYVGDGSGSTVFTIYSAAAGTFYVFGAQSTTSQLIMPYIATNDSTATRGADSVSISVENNLPASGEPLTIAQDFVYNGESGFLFETENRGVGLYVDASGNAIARGLTAEGIIANGLISGDKYRLIMTYDGSYCHGYVNGELILSTLTPDINYNVSESLIIGSNSSDQYLNSTIENFKVWHKLLTPSQIASMGGAE